MPPASSSSPPAAGDENHAKGREECVAPYTVGCKKLAELVQLGMHEHAAESLAGLGGA